MGKNFVLVSDEYQIWMLHCLEPNKQTWGEWIRGEEIPQIEDRYIFKKDQWEPGVEISIIYSPWDECDWKEIYRGETTELSLCYYLIENVSEKTCAFARRLDVIALNRICHNLCREAEKRAALGYHLVAAEIYESLLPYSHFISTAEEEWLKKLNGEDYDEQFATFYENNTESLNVTAREKKR